MRKTVIGLIAITIATSAIAQVFIKKTEAEAKQAWPLQSECQTCRLVLIDLEPIYKRLCGRNISDAETPFLLGQMPIKRMVSIREKEQLIKLRDAELNLHEADLVTYRINSKRMKCVSQEEVAGITSDRPQAPTE
ncbi:hypothetical protein [Undibacterium sp. TS12]|uniref:hypothetical protein n=1 Tax=Undibacterium sp. TS12 TaxID=2908202 RepID=UPI001F4CD10E|nr:hypothetical protein [Undibacterium sp. TS12]MCH8622937.1 hypothetical protein [Undibacterium sp. TS12]